MRRSLRYTAALGAVLALSLVIAGGAEADGPRHHQVVTGDNLWNIADTYDVTVDELIKLNHIEYPDLVLPGQTLELPSAPPAPGTIEYDVQADETLSHIALRF